MKTKRGFTLLELMIVVAIIAIIASIAVPSYLKYIRKTRRNEVEAAIQQAVLMEERFRADCPTYGTKTTFGTQSSPVVCATDPIGPNPYAKDGIYYTVKPSVGTATQYSITATAVAGSGQDKDLAGGTKCTPLTYDFGTTPGVVAKSPAACW